MGSEYVFMSYSDDVAEAEVRHMRSRIISRMKSLAFSAGNLMEAPLRLSSV